MKIIGKGLWLAGPLKVPVKAAAHLLADFGLDRDTGPARLQSRNDVVVPVVAQRLFQIVQGDSMKTQGNSLRLSVQARSRPAHTDPSLTGPDLRQPY
jgi:hypothetical protein